MKRDVMKTLAREAATRANAPCYNSAEMGATQAMKNDLGLGLVREFHQAFGCATTAEPWLPELSAADVQFLQNLAGNLAKVAAVLKEQCAELNGLGRYGLALLLVRLQLMVEETGEVAGAFADRDLPKVLRELADMRYVVNGTYLTTGLGDHLRAADLELHRANMSKLGPDGQPIIHPSGRVVKGPAFVPPDMVAVLEGRL